jgi:type IX secretion system PorP/SprF family membrane protein
MKIILFILTIIIASGAYGQNFPGTSQYMFTGMTSNPAYAGSHEALAASLLYRNQWEGVQGAPSTKFFSTHTPLNNQKIALGLTIYSESLSIHENTAAFLNYAYRFRIGRGKLSFGLKGGFDMFNDNWNSVKTTKDNDPAFATPSAFYMFPNFGIGAYYYDDQLFGGISIPFLFSYKEESTGSGFKLYHRMNNYNYFMTFGGTILNGDQLKIQPSIFAKYQKFNGMQLDLNSFFIINNQLGIGVGYRLSNEIISIIQYKINKQLRLGYAYDYSLGYLNNYNHGSHEILLQYKFSYYIEAVNPRY